MLLPMPEASTRTAALLSGQVNFVEAPTPDALPRLKSSGMRIVAFGPLVLGRSRAQAAVDEALRRVGLDPVQFGPRYPHELSGGQKQRVNIA